MKECKNIRDKLGLSQQALAEYLGISRSHLSMVEKNRRQLGTKTLLKLYKLVRMVEEAAQAEVPPPTPEEVEQQREELRLCVEEYERETRHKMDRMQARLNRMREARHMWAEVLRNCAMQPLDSPQATWWDLNRAEAERELDKLSDGRMLLLDIRIKALEHSIAYGYAMIETWPDVTV